ncbi:putative hydro-lyase [Roseobacter sp. YSTF-M11]|uniref:Putative hydro-lyase KX928_14755 n=1 Tax=Roseobacter insulae TaxID=2859783 RepID=A0A9X1K2Z3_9RHOB|nr:putative hydro-lyase [Roseobacter insulae]MBW4709048.1 putative hydro-lyase [Roseobacter insulae]
MTTTRVSHVDLVDQTAAQVRAAIRNGDYDGHTAGLAAGKLQCNLAILPERFALDFLRFCQRNPKPCPIVAVGDSGDPMLPTLGHDIDIRTDVPRYSVFRNGQLSDEVTDISREWSDDLVTVALGCSFTFENALLRNGVPVRHLETGKNVPMYRSDIALVSAGMFGGDMVVTMRPIPEHLVDQAKEISRRYPQAHGAPIAMGDPAQIGISDLTKPDWGDAVEIKPGEVPVYWACGVTPQNVLLQAALPICITHAPGHMLIADVAEGAETTILPNH